MDDLDLTDIFRLSPTPVSETLIISPDSVDTSLAVARDLPPANSCIAMSPPPVNDSSLSEDHFSPTNILPSSSPHIGPDSANVDSGLFSSPPPVQNASSESIFNSQIAPLSSCIIRPKSYTRKKKTNRALKEVTSGTLTPVIEPPEISNTGRPYRQARKRPTSSVWVPLPRKKRSFSKKMVKCASNVCSLPESSPPIPFDEEFWINCSLCFQWFHRSCLDALTLPIAPSSNFSCNDCRAPPISLSSIRNSEHFFFSLPSKMASTYEKLDTRTLVIALLKRLDELPPATFVPSPLTVQLNNDDGSTRSESPNYDDEAYSYPDPIDISSESPENYSKGSVAKCQVFPVGDVPQTVAYGGHEKTVSSSQTVADSLRGIYSTPPAMKEASIDVRSLQTALENVLSGETPSYRRSPSSAKVEIGVFNRIRETSDSLGYPSVEKSLSPSKDDDGACVSHTQESSSPDVGTPYFRYLVTPEMTGHVWPVHHSSRGPIEPRPTDVLNWSTVFYKGRTMTTRSTQTEHDFLHVYPIIRDVRVPAGHFLPKGSRPCRVCGEYSHNIEECLSSNPSYRLPGSFFPRMPRARRQLDPSSPAIPCSRRRSPTE